MPKRRQPSSSAMTGTFTRNRAEIFLHRTRSGLARPDPARRKNHPRYPFQFPPAAVTAEAADLDGAVRISIKDLRARRVFSPASVTTDCFPDQPSKIKPYGEQIDVIEGTEKQGTGEQKNGDTVKVLSESMVEGNEENLQPTPPPDLGSLQSQNIGDETFATTLDAPGSGVQGEEEGVQGTPPDLELLRKLDRGDERDAMKTDVEQTDQAAKASGDDRHAAEVTSCRTEPVSNNPLKNRLGIAPCSRSKLYRNLSSFSYRRLLPYLQDLENNRSGGVEISDVSTNQIKFEKNTEEMPLLKNREIKSEKNTEEMPLLKNRDALPTEKDHVVGSEDPPTVTSRENLVLVEKHVPENPKSTLPQEVDDMKVIESPELFNSESSLQTDRVTSDTPLESYYLEFEPSCKLSFSPPIGHGALSIEELSGDVLTHPPLPRRDEEGCGTPVATLETDRKTGMPTSPIRRPGPLRNHSLTPKKSILKRHTRGCKGLCMCLDCASFRLHAERSFEFSRKQMQEADEVVLGLLKELSSLRTMVEKSVAPLDNGAGNYTVLQLKQEQVKGVCLRASKVEQLAKSYLKQMISELNIHCRIPGPRVAFAEYVEERCIPQLAINVTK